MRLFSALTAALLSLALTACGTSQPVVPARAGLSPAAVGSSSISGQAQAVRLRKAANKWRGVPHQWGGETKKGIDCSGLVQSIYRDVLGYRLPRTTRQQAQTGVRVRRSALRPGDLVFFRVDSRKGRHVGVYLSDGEFLHASSSSGVTIASLDQPYWTARWWQARRLHPNSSSTNRPSSPGTTSIGW